MIVASKAFYEKFGVKEEHIEGKLFYEIGDGEWNIPALRELFVQVIPEKQIVERYEVSHEFKHLGKRIMLVTARELKYEYGQRKMLLTIIDITEEHKADSEKTQLMQQKDILLKEIRHRIANSLQLIASILLLRAETVTSKETKAHLKDAHERILSIATVQQQLDPVESGEAIEVVKYL